MSGEAITTQETSQPGPAFIQLRGEGRVAERTLPDGTVLKITHNVRSNYVRPNEDPERLLVSVESIGIYYNITPQDELTNLGYRPGFRPSALGLPIDSIVFSLSASQKKRLRREPQYPAMVQALVDWTQRLATADSLEVAGLPFPKP